MQQQIPPLVNLKAISMVPNTGTLPITADKYAGITGLALM